MRMRFAAVALALTAAVACGKDAPTAPDTGPFRYELHVTCPAWDLDHAACSVEIAGAARGDTLLFLLLLRDTSLTHAFSHRAGCDHWLELWRGSQLALRLPDYAPGYACPDSTVRMAAGMGLEGYLWWTIPADFTPGAYTVRAVLLADPPGYSVSRRLTIY